MLESGVLVNSVDDDEHRTATHLCYVSDHEPERRQHVSRYENGVTASYISTEKQGAVVVARQRLLDIMLAQPTPFVLLREQTHLP
jgi:hypothetical protein